jgi:hypothetical protein
MVMEQRTVVAVVMTDGRLDVRFVDALARLQLVARRHGCTIVLTDPDEDLVALVELTGLRGVLPCGEGARTGRTAPDR